MFITPTKRELKAENGVDTLWLRRDFNGIFQTFRLPAFQHGHVGC
jgi:hypothetical protein